ncbi:MAG: glutamate-5-semialdehyde dehydrogenase [Bacillaceae bacterium]|nr:glutamate-5-semialdehyde dehydrogenase [Bacillaceae bacterium]
MSDLIQKAELAKSGVRELASQTEESKNQALYTIADALVKNRKFILQENEKDVAAARERGESDALIDRLTLTEKRIEDMAEGIRQVVELPDPVGEVLEEWERPNGLNIKKVRVPLGVIGMIYEARPNVTVDATSLCLKTGNAVLLRGSSSAIQSNRAIVRVIHEALRETPLPETAVQLVEDTSRETAGKMLKLNDYLDVLIPRGGAGLIQSVVQNASVPVLETGVGNCHIYIDESADAEKAINIAYNAKTDRPAVCNAAESLLVQRDWAEKHLSGLVEKLQNAGVEIRACERARQLIPGLKAAVEEDWGTEYLDLIISLKLVDDVEEAVAHINRYGTHHSESIVTESQGNAAYFQQQVDAAAVYHNASTRFTDGFEFGFGAEIGISTQKLHARGPMGLPALTSYKYVINGNGQVR